MREKRTAYIFFTLTFLLLTISVQAFAQDTFRLFTSTPSDSVVVNYLKEKNVRVSQNNKVILLKSGREKFNDLFAHIRQAEHFIHLEYFNFRNDSIAKELFVLLGQKAREGVKIRAMFDAFGNLSNNKPLKKKHIKLLLQHGIEIIEFDPMRFPYINHALSRDHQKIVIIDGKVGYTGGMNIANYYINGLPEIGAWRDMHARIEGDAVNDLQDIFLKMWNAETGQQIGGDEYYPLRTGAATADGDKQVAIVNRMKKVQPALLRHTYIEAIKAAKRKVQLINPYFTPTHSIVQALEDAIARGVRVEIMIPGKSDIPFTPDAALYAANHLRKKGAFVYIYNGGFHHSKVMMIDDRFCTIGSMNLNSRSLRWDYEVNAFIFDLETTAELVEMFNEDKKNSTILTKDVYLDVPVRKRIKGWFARLFTPFL